MNHDGTPLPGLLCPYCSARMDCADGMPTNRRTAPSAGAVAICGECTQPSMFVDGPLGLAVRKPTSSERAAIMAQIGAALLGYRMRDRPR